MRKYYLDGDLFYPSGKPGYAQVPHRFGSDHIALLNDIASHGIRKVDSTGKVYFVLDEQA